MAFIFVFIALRSDYQDIHVKIGPDAYIHTIVFEPDQPPSVDEEPRVPLVMIHGFGCGIPQYYKNFDHLHSNRKLYAIDLPGFARSTRVEFSADAEQCEQDFVDYIEKWRKGLGLEKFILLGHSLGAYLSCAYTMRHPNRVRHLILNDPWGFPLKPSRIEVSGKRHLVYTAAVLYTKKFNPLSPIRVAGPLGMSQHNVFRFGSLFRHVLCSLVLLILFNMHGYVRVIERIRWYLLTNSGPYLMTCMRPDLARIFGSDFMNYVYHTNAQSPT